MPNIYDTPVYLDFKNTYVPVNLDMVARTAAMMDARGDQAEELQWQIENDLYKVNALKEDKAERDAKIAEYDQGISEALKKAGGDYTKMLPYMKEQRRTLQRDLMMGDFAQMQKNYNAYNTWVKEHEKRVADGDVNSMEWRKQQAIARDKYLGYEHGDIQLSEMVNQHNYGEIAMDIASKMKSQTTTTLGEWVKGKGMSGNNLPTWAYQRLNTEIENLSEKEIYDVVDAYIRENPYYQDHLNQAASIEAEYEERIVKKNLDDYVKENASSMTDDDRTTMVSLDLDPDSVNDQREYLTMKFKAGIRQNYIDQTIHAAALPAAETFDVHNVKIDADIFKDDAARKSLEKSAALNGAVFMSGTSADITSLDYDMIKEQIGESNRAVKDNETILSTNLVDLGSRQLSDDSAGYTGEAKLDYLREKLNADDKTYYNEIVNQIVNNKGVDELEAKKLLGQFIDGLDAMKTVYTKRNQQQAVFNNATTRVMKEKGDEYWQSMAEKLNSYGQTVVGQNNKWTGESLKEAMLEAGADDAKWQEMFGSHPEIYNKISEARMNGTLTEAEYAENYRRATIYQNQFVKMKDELNEDVEVEMADAIARSYTKFDFGKVADDYKQSNEYLTASSAVNDLGTNVVVNGVSTNLKTAFLGDDNGTITDISSHLVADFGKPMYAITAKVKSYAKNSKAQYVTILAEVPGRETPSANLMKQLYTNSDQGVKDAAATYLGANMMGDYYTPDRYDAMSPGGSPIPLRLSNGKILGYVHKNKQGNLNVLDGEGNSIPGFDRYYTSASAIAKDLYDWKVNVYDPQRIRIAQASQENRATTE